MFEYTCRYCANFDISIHKCYRWKTSKLPEMTCEEWKGKTPEEQARFNNSIQSQGNTAFWKNLAMMTRQELVEEYAVLADDYAETKAKLEQALMENDHLISRIGGFKDVRKEKAKDKTEKD